ncbi:hypothetical protein FRB99_001934 [Tulasnella sp. 403]|nr:hypothetical protein FRB99_001934 [Tulasnella sp. 403]
MFSITVVMGTFLIYDILLTFDREYRYIWKARWSLSKILFLLNRYLAPLKLWLGPPTATPVMATINTVLIIRTYAIYECRPAVLYVLVISYLLSFGGAYAYFYYEIRDLITEADVQTMKNIALVRQALVQSGDESEGWLLWRCYTNGSPRALTALMVAALLYEIGSELAGMSDSGLATTTGIRFAPRDRDTIPSEDDIVDELEAMQSHCHSGSTSLEVLDCNPDGTRDWTNSPAPYLRHSSGATAS